nr:reverse transcriptase domain-containing protein [Tanacetum cinerariifolium]
MADQRTMAELLHAPTEGYAEAIMVPPILAEQFKLKHILINMMTSNYFFRLEKDNPHDHIRRSKQPFTLEESHVDTMADQRTMAELLHAPTEGYAEAIMVPPILAEQFKLKHILINMMTSNYFFRLEKDNPHDHIRWGSPPNNKSRNEISNFQQRFDESFHEAWDRYKDLLRACPHHGFTELHQLDTFYNALNPADQDSLNAAAGGNLLERRTQDVLTIIENKSKVRNSQSKSVVSQVKACDVNSNSYSEIAKLTHTVYQQTSAVTTSMTAILKQFQATPPLASVKAVEETCVTCGGAHPYYQCLVVGGNTFPELRDNIQGYVLAAAVNYNQGNPGYRPPSMANQIQPQGFAQPNVQNNQNRFGPPQGFTRGNNFNPEHSYQAPAQQNQNVHLNKLEKVRRMNEANMKAMQTQIDMVKNKLRNEMKNSIQTSLSNQTNEIKNMMASLLQMNTVSTSGSGSLPSNTVANSKGKLKAITTRSGLVIDGPTKLQELANTPLNENCSAVILKKLPKKLGDLREFLIPCGFNELKCKALANLGACIDLMPLSVWKKLGLPELISTRMTLELANRTICTPTGIARDVFIPVGNFTFPVDFVIIDYESDPRVPLILERPFLQTSRALIDVMQSYFLSHPELTSLEVNDDIFDSEGGNILSEKLLDLDSTKDLHLLLHDNQLSSSTTYSFSSNPLLEEFTDELTLITFPPKYDDDLQINIETDLKEIEFLLHQDLDSSLKDSIDLANPTDNVVDSVPEMFTDEDALDYSSHLIFDEYDDDFLKIKSDVENVYDDPFDSKGEKIKESKLLIDELDLLCDFLPFEDLLRACPHHGFTELHQLDTFYNALNPTDQDSLNSATGGNLLERHTQDVLTIIENKFKVHNSQNKSIVSLVKSSDGNSSSSSSEIAKLTHADNIQGYVLAAAVNYSHGNSGYHPSGVANQIRPPGFAQLNVQNNKNWFSKPQGYNQGNNFNQDSSYQAPIQQNQVVPLIINPLSGSTTSSTPNHLLEEFIDELALITFPLRNDDLPFDIESDHREIEYLLNHDPTKETDSILEDSVDEDNVADPNNDLVDTIPEMFTDEHTLDYSSPPLSSDFLPSLEYDSFLFEDFSEVDAFPSTNNEDKVFNSGILIHENLFEVTNRVAPDKNVKKMSISHAYLILKDFNLPLYDHKLPFQEVLSFKTLLLFSSKYEEKVFKPRILTSKGVHTSLFLKLSHQGTKAFKVIKILESLMEIFPCSYGEDIRILDVPHLHFYTP